MSVAGASSTDPPSPADLHLLHLTSFELVAPYWEELSRTYKGGELVLDLAAHALIWERFHAPRDHELLFVVALQGRRCVGIFPLHRSSADPFCTSHWSLSDDVFIAREYFCPPAVLPLVADLLPPHAAEDMSCFYTPAAPDRFVRSPGGVVDLGASEEAYLAGLRHGPRQHLRRTLRANADLRVDNDIRVRSDELADLWRVHLDRWGNKRDGLDPAYSAYCRDKSQADLALMGRAAEMGRLLALYLYLGDELVAANFSVRREHDRVDDYLCVRNGAEHLAHRGLGIFAILQNMELCRQLGVRFYDLSSCRAPYKQKFDNMRSEYYSLTYPGIPTERGQAPPPPPGLPSSPVLPAAS